MLLMVVVFAVDATRKNAHLRKINKKNNYSSFHKRMANSTEEKVKMVRKLVRECKAVALSANSAISGFEGYTDVILQIPADGGRGIPYLYISPKEVSGLDLSKDYKASLLYSQSAIDDSCDNYPLKAKDSKCAKAMLIGKITKVYEDDEDYQFGYDAIIEKVPGYADVDKEEFELLKMIIEGIFLRSEDGSPDQLSVDAYINAASNPN
ncbi:protein CREG1-like [Ctenocephalides felis]|uniref:protein CREG1-like n=1 Tax=Ctenocephalides felis TaxID=7515 RepID=UPI000E6E5477|nr:protein CREG1-like [Ctenocephalides felis]